MRDEDFFWEGARAGRLLVQKCADCGLVRHPPAPMCGRCHSTAAQVIECSGQAKVLGWLVSRHPTRPDDAPRIVVRLELPEGVYMVSNLHGIALQDITYGLPVEIFFEDFDGMTLPQCRPAGRVAA